MTNPEAAVVNPANDKPILDQIFDELFVQLAVHPDVSEGMLERVRQLAQSGQLKKPDKAIEAIKTTTRADNETDRA